MHVLIRVEGRVLGYRTIAGYKRHWNIVLVRQQSVVSKNVLLSGYNRKQSAVPSLFLPARTVLGDRIAIFVILAV